MLDALGCGTGADRWRDGVVRVLVGVVPGIRRRRIVVHLEERPEIEVAAEADEADEAIAEARRLLPDVVLIDADIPRIGAIRTVASVREVAPHAHVIVLTRDGEEAEELRTLRAGATGFLGSRHLDGVADAVLAVHAGRPLLPPAVAGALAEPAVGVPHPASPGAAIAPPAPEEIERAVLLRWAAGDDLAAAAGAAGVPEPVAVAAVANRVELVQQAARAEAVMYTAAPKIFG